MKKILFTITILMALNTFASGSGSGVSGGNYLKSFSDSLDLKSEKLMEFKQVYYMRQKQAEIEFATNIPGDNKVDIQSLRPEEIASPALLEGLKRSQQTRQWENIKIPSNVELNRNLQKFDRSFQNSNIRY